MRHRTRTLLVPALLAIAWIAAVAAPAQASRSISSSSTSIGAGGSLSFNNDRLICDFLVQIALSRNPIPKAAGTAIGTLSQGFIRNCIGPVAAAAPNNTGTILAGSTFSYVSFSGRLPTITSIGISSTNFGFSFNTLAGNCLYRASVANPLVGVSLDSPASNTVTSLTSTNDPIDRASGSILCPASLAINGVLRVLAPAPRLTLL